MSKKRKSYSADFKQDAVSRMAQAKTITGLARELGVRRKFLYLWRDQLQTGGRAAAARIRNSHRTGKKYGDMMCAAEARKE
jgi:transposase-like protein